MDTNKIAKQSKPQGLTREQLQAQLDQFDGQRHALEQSKVILEFDLKNYHTTLIRQLRETNRTLKLTNSNIRVIKKQMSRLR